MGMLLSLILFIAVVHCNYVYSNEEILNEIKTLMRFYLAPISITIMLLIAIAGAFIEFEKNKKYTLKQLSQSIGERCVCILMSILYTGVLHVLIFETNSFFVLDLYLAASVIFILFLYAQHYTKKRIVILLAITNMGILLTGCSILFVFSYDLANTISLDGEISYETFNVLKGYLLEPISIIIILLTPLIVTGVGIIAREDEDRDRIAMIFIEKRSLDYAKKHEFTKEMNEKYCDLERKLVYERSETKETYKTKSLYRSVLNRVFLILQLLLVILGLYIIAYFELGSFLIYIVYAVAVYCSIPVPDLLPKDKKMPVFLDETI
jgi:hypothetical protein